MQFRLLNYKVTFTITVISAVKINTRKVCNCALLNDQMGWKLSNYTLTLDYASLNTVHWLLEKIRKIGMEKWLHIIYNYLFASTYIWCHLSRLFVFSKYWCSCCYKRELFPKQNQIPKNCSVKIPKEVHVKDFTHLKRGTMFGIPKKFP